MSWPRYGRYKPSGVEWLGELPAHWEVKPLKRVVRVAGGMTPDRSNPSFWDGDIPWVTAKDMKVSRLRDSEDHVSVQALRQTGLRVIHPPAVLMVVRGMILAHTLPVAEIDRPVTVNQDMKVLRAIDGLDSSYLAWVLRGSSAYTLSIADESAHGTKALRSNALFDVPMPLPPVPEQRAVAAFLDRETARLDALIEKRRRMIALLQEKRAALISHAVTRGLDPKVPLTDSGVEWLGQIPAHWVVSPVAARYGVQLGKMLDEKRILGLTLAPYLRNVDVQWENINTHDLPMMDFSERDRKKFSLRSGDLLVCEGGEVGRTAIWAGNLEACYFQKALHRLRPIKPTEDEPTFMRYLMCCAAERGLFAASGNANTIDHLTANKLRRHRFGFPPCNEQRLIALTLDAKCAGIDGIQLKLGNSLATLDEYRAALITAAVTGQIDVRRTIPEPATEADKEPAL